MAERRATFEYANFETFARDHPDLLDKSILERWYPRKRLLKVLKALAEYKNMTLGDLLEGIVLHAFEGKRAFSAHTLVQIENLKGIYGSDLSAADSHHLEERARE